jgi:hypothetical protein
MKQILTLVILVTTTLSISQNKINHKLENYMNASLQLIILVELYLLQKTVLF